MDKEVRDDADEEVGPFERTIFSSGRNIRNPASRFVHCSMILPLLLVLALSITSLSYFAVTDDRVGDVNLDKCSGECILYADYDEHNNCLDLSSNHACVFSIFGEVAVAVLASLLIVWMIIKASAGFHMATWILLCEIPVFVVHVLFAFCVSITISIGLAVTCSEYAKFPHAKGGCGNYTLPKPSLTDAVVYFHDHIHKSMVTSWLVVVLLFTLLAAHVFFFIFFCVRRVRNSGHDLLPASDGESSSDGDSTDEAMVPIAELERR